MATTLSAPSAFGPDKDARRTIQFELWRDLIRTDHHAMACFILITGLRPGFMSGLAHAAVDEAVEDIATNNNWNGMARPVELDLTIDGSSQAREVVGALVTGNARLVTAVPLTLATKRSDRCWLFLGLLGWYRLCLCDGGT